MAQEGSRRGFLAGALVLPAVFLGTRALAGLRRAARRLRPRADGRSTTRCAVCGSTDHAMLRCPRSPEVV
ncbi:MAG: hypothetical protein KatS3mg013_0003 [Actinomycetota bacterium]|nr:MAG: hypothetical protein KatS3mg013_0003 [Actinomycetota bacterium]